MLIAIEIGGTKLQLALGREDGTIVKTVRGRVKAEDGAQGILAWFDAQTSALLQEYGQMAADSNTAGVEMDRRKTRSGRSASASAGRWRPRQEPS